MDHFGGSLANKIGKYRWNMADACACAVLTFARCDDGRIWNTAERFSSDASASVISRKYRSAFRRPSTAMSASWLTRQSTNAASGSGSSSADDSARIYSTLGPERPVGVWAAQPGVRNCHLINHGEAGVRHSSSPTFYTRRVPPRVGAWTDAAFLSRGSVRHPLQRSGNPRALPVGEAQQPRQPISVSTHICSEFSRSRGQHDRYFDRLHICLSRPPIPSLELHQ